MPWVVISYVACAVIWGTTYFAIRVSIGPGGYPTYAAAALRFVAAALVLWTLVAAGLARPAPRGRALIGRLLLSGLLNFTSYTLIYTAEERIPGGLAAVIFGTLPLVTALLAGLLGVERPARSAIVGALISLGGLALLSLDRLDGSVAEALGCVMVLGSVICTATYNMILKKHTREVHPLAANATFLSVTAVLMTCLATGAGHPVPWPPAVVPSLAIVYLALIGTAVAFAGYFYLLPRVSLMTLSTLVFVQPLIALVVDALFERQKIPARAYVGVAAILTGMAVNLGGAITPRKSPPGDPPR